MKLSYAGGLDNLRERKPNSVDVAWNKIVFSHFPLQGISLVIAYSAIGICPTIFRSEGMSLWL